MSKLHELLAVEPDLKGSAEKIIKETVNTFTKKEHHFIGRHKSYKPIDEEGDTFAPETQEMVTTVLKKLEHTQEVVGKYLDAMAQKELTNTTASAILEVDGQVLFDAPLPATLLLAIEGRLKQLREAYNAIPTLDPSETWKWDTATGTYEASSKETYKTKKVYRNHVVAAATDKHPSQVQVFTEDERIGAWTEKKWSGMITPAEKALILGRIDTLAQAVKRARKRANDAEVKIISIGDALLNFINAPLKK
jgi:transcription termination factor NusB